MDLKSTDFPSTVSASWTTLSPEWASNSTPTGRYYRWIGEALVWAPSLRHSLQLSVIFLFRDLKYAKQYFGQILACLRWSLRDHKHFWRLRLTHWSSRLKAFRALLSSRAYRMCWQCILLLRTPILRAQVLVKHYQVKSQTNLISPLYRQKIGDQ